MDDFDLIGISTDLPPAAFRWDLLNDDDHLEYSRDLARFVDWLVARYRLQRHIPPCWWQHGAHVEELSALFTAWRGVMEVPGTLGLLAHLARGARPPRCPPPRPLEQRMHPRPPHRLVTAIPRAARRRMVWRGLTREPAAIDSTGHVRQPDSPRRRRRHGRQRDGEPSSGRSIRLTDDKEPAGATSRSPGTGV